ncbi:protein-export chaperone SecB [Bacillus spizizenii]|uniref:protein-export chaperone SecB n=1 Tax=Bacillus spizizenii TaxID=96241 RepID=UPI000B43197B|nr:protein-export chaperone SecB [Bacillus spizizenii]MEC1586154.1 protein-export chaperone SecB [Bacillus spizizenii]OUL03389.1 hypothetical protein B0W20_16840 [Bacillus spizizenii]
MKSFFQFDDYNIIDVNYKFNNNFESDEAVLSPIFDFELEFEDETKDEADLILGIELGDKDLVSNSFYLNCKVQGHFIFNNDEFPEEEKVKFFKVNGVSILFPYLRSLVSDLTSKGSEQPVILPTMNVAQMIKDQEEKHNKYK